MEFNNIEFLWLLILVLPLIFILLYFKKNSSLSKYFDKEVLIKLQYKNNNLSKSIRDIMIIISFFLLIIALARPFIDNGSVKVNSSNIDIVVGFDISKSMFVSDIFPNRFEFAKTKFQIFLNYMKQAQVSVIAFSSSAFLISPLTQDISSLQFLVKNMSFDNLSLKGTDINSPLEVTTDILKDSKKKAILLFTDGGDKNDYSKEIKYAKDNKISVFVYALGTDKGGMIKTESGVAKDDKGNIIISKLNKNIKNLAFETGGAYVSFSTNLNDIIALADNIKSKFKAKESKETTIKNREEMFIYPLSLALFILLLSFISFPQFKGKKQ